MKLQPDNITLWLWLLRDGGAWSALDLAEELQRPLRETSRRLYMLQRRGLLSRLEPIAGSSAARYAVTASCVAPQGLLIGQIGERPRVATLEHPRAITEAGLQPLTARQLELLTYLREFHAVNDQLPPPCAISRRFVISTSTVAEHLARIEEAGWLDRNELGNLRFARATLRATPPSPATARRGPPPPSINLELIRRAA